MKRYLSHGGGLNSWALYLWLRDHGIEFEAVYASHGADWPETEQYMRDRIAEGYPVTILETRRDGVPIYDYYWQYSCIPMRTARWCTDHWKVRPLNAYMRPPSVVYLGIDHGEQHRVARLAGYQRDDKIKEFPLVDERIDRKGCIEIIKSHGLPLPMKSGCIFCPHQRVGQVRELRTRHPELFCKVVALERRANLARPERGPYYLVGDRPFDVVAQDGQADLWGERDMRPCACELPT